MNCLEKLQNDLQGLEKVSYTKWYGGSTLDLRGYRFCLGDHDGLTLMKEDLKVFLTDVKANVSRYNNSTQVHIELINEEKIVGEIYFYKED